MKRKRAEFLKLDRGQTMAEMAVVLPMLLFVLFAIIQFGLLFNNYITLTDAVRAGARTAAVSRHYDDRVSRTVEKVRASAANLNTSSTTLKISVTSSWSPGSDVTVGAQYPYKISLMGLVVKSGWLSSTTVERVE